MPQSILPTDSDAIARDKLITAIGINASRIRQKVKEFRSDVTPAMQALARQGLMASLPEINVGAAFVVKGAEMKLSSTTAITGFPFSKVGKKTFNIIIKTLINSRNSGQTIIKSHNIDFLNWILKHELITFS